MCSVVMVFISLLFRPAKGGSPRDSGGHQAPQTGLKFFEMSEGQKSRIFIIFTFVFLLPPLFSLPLRSLSCSNHEDAIRGQRRQTGTHSQDLSFWECGGELGVAGGRFWVPDVERFAFEVCELVYFTVAPPPPAQCKEWRGGKK